MSTSPQASRPRRFQFSLVGLLIAIGWVALVSLALKTPTAAWCAAMFLIAAVAALSSALGIVYLVGRSRAFAVGYCLFSVGYGASLFVVEKEFSSKQYIFDTKFPTTYFAEWLFGKLHSSSAFPPMGGGLGGGFGGYGGGGFGGQQPGGMGGGGFFSVDSSIAAERADTANEFEPTEGTQMPLTIVEAADPLNLQVQYGDLGGAMGASAEEVPTDAGTGSVPGMGPTIGGTPPVAPPVFYHSSHFVAIVHCVLATLMGFVGGVIAQQMHASRGSSAVPVA